MRERRLLSIAVCSCLGLVYRSSPAHAECATVTTLPSALYHSSSTKQFMVKGSTGYSKDIAKAVQVPDAPAFFADKPDLSVWVALYFFLQDAAMGSTTGERYMHEYRPKQNLSGIKLLQCTDYWDFKHELGVYSAAGEQKMADANFAMATQFCEDFGSEYAGFVITQAPPVSEERAEATAEYILCDPASLLDHRAPPTAFELDAESVMGPFQWTTRDATTTFAGTRYGYDFMTQAYSKWSGSQTRPGPLPKETGKLRLPNKTPVSPKTYTVTFRLSSRVQNLAAFKKRNLPAELSLTRNRFTTSEIKKAALAVWKWDDSECYASFAFDGPPGSTRPKLERLNIKWANRAYIVEVQPFDGDDDATCWATP